MIKILEALGFMLSGGFIGYAIGLFIAGRHITKAEISAADWEHKYNMLKIRTRVLYGYNEDDR